MLPVEQPFKTYTGLDGKPLDNGYVYFGQPHEDPITKPVTVYWDAAGTKPAAQPLRTVGGYIMNNGTPANLFFDGAYSELVQDKKQQQVFYARTSDDFSIATTVLTFLANIAAKTGASLMGFAQAGIGAIKRTVLDELRDNVSIKQYGAVGDGVADDSDEILAAAAYARQARKALRINAGTYQVSKPIDFSGMTVFGDGTMNSVIKATAAQFDVVTTTGNTSLRDFQIHGGWDGATAGQLGHAVAATAAAGSYPYNVHLDNLRILNAKKDGVYIARGGYSSINRCKINACGLHAIELYGSGPGNYCTTVHIGGMTTASDCPNGYGLMMTNAQNISTAGVISEYTKGIHTSGSDNRAIALRSYYQEWTSGGLFFSTDGSGIGLLVEGCFGGGHAMQELPSWESVRLDCNTNLVECSSTANTGRAQLVISGELVQAAGFTGDFTVCSFSLKPGAWEVSASLQSNTASAPGVGKMTRMAFRVTTDNTQSGYAPATNGNFAECADMVDFQTATDIPARLSSNYIFRNNTGAPVTLYLRAYFASTAGIFATKGALRAVKM